MSEKNMEQTILEWYQKNYKFIDAPCDGKGNCGRCKVRFFSDAPMPQEKDKKLLSQEEIDEGIRLACVTKMPKTVCFEPVFKVTELQREVVVHLSELAEEYGVAIDIGTTTIAMCLVSLLTGEKVATITAVNKQRVYGADVISRIQASNEGKLLEMQYCIQQELFELLLQLIDQSEIDAGQIKKLVIVANTTMCHILLGHSCIGLGKAPFTPVDISLRKMSIGELLGKVEAAKRFSAQVTIFPSISVFVGGDIVAGIYACDMDLKEEPHMLLDIGTNGEMVVGNQNGFYVTSTAAGPVFEGGNISCGMPAVEGAIAHIACQNGQWKWEILGYQKEKEAVGFCGSGLVDLTAELWKQGLIDENGTITEEFFDCGVPIGSFRILQSDIREIQMAKAAIRAGMEVLKEKYVAKRVLLAGGLGTVLNVDSAIEIGLFPREIENNILPVGNTALAGAIRFLRDEMGEKRVTDIVRKSQELTLANEGNFEENYILFLQFLL